MLLFFAAQVPKDSIPWLLDLGVSRHMTGGHEFLCDTSYVSLYLLVCLMDLKLR